MLHPANISSAFATWGSLLINHWSTFSAYEVFNGSQPIASLFIDAAAFRVVIGHVDPAVRYYLPLSVDDVVAYAKLLSILLVYWAKSSVEISIAAVQALFDNTTWLSWMAALYFSPVVLGIISKRFREYCGSCPEAVRKSYPKSLLFIVLFLFLIEWGHRTIDHTTANVPSCDRWFTASAWIHCKEEPTEAPRKVQYSPSEAFENVTRGVSRSVETALNATKEKLTVNSTQKFVDELAFPIYNAVIETAFEMTHPRIRGPDVPTLPAPGSNYDATASPPPHPAKTTEKTLLGIRLEPKEENPKSEAPAPQPGEAALGIRLEPNEETPKSGALAPQTPLSKGTAAGAEDDPMVAFRY
jgi:hypothetical protein